MAAVGARPGSRFVVNVPEDELRSFERICFQIEQAHWFYEDFFREQNPSLPRLSLRDFASASTPQRARRRTTAV